MKAVLQAFSQCCWSSGRALIFKCTRDGVETPASTAQGPGQEQDQQKTKATGSVPFQ